MIVVLVPENVAEVSVFFVAPVHVPVPPVAEGVTAALIILLLPEQISEGVAVRIAVGSA